MRSHMAMNDPDKAITLLKRAKEKHKHLKEHLMPLERSIYMLYKSLDPPFDIFCGNPPQNARDPVQMFPIELVVNHILRDTSTRKLCQLLRVSKKWQITIEKSPSLWQTLIFPDTITIIRRSDIWRAILKARGQLKRLEIGDCLARADSRILIAELVSLPDKSEITFPTELNWSSSLEISRSDLLQNLESLRLSFCSIFGRIELWDTLAYSIMKNLKDLHVRFEDSESIMPLVLTGHLPNLEELRFQLPYKIIKFHHRVTYNTNEQFLKAKPKIHQKLQVLQIGGPTNFLDHFPYTQDHQRWEVCVTDLRSILQFFPNLLELHLIACHTVDQFVSEEFIPALTESYLLDLLSLTPQLEVLNLDRSQLYTMPSIPKTCRKLILNGFLSTLPYPIVLIDGTWHFDDFGVSREVPAKRVDEFKSIKDLTLLSFSRADHELITHLARFDAGLEALNLNETSESINWKSSIAGRHISVLSDPSAYGLSSALARSGTLIETVGAMFPGLRRLSIGYNWMVDDSVLQCIGSQFSELEYLDISGTAISSLGVTKLLWRSCKDAQMIIEGYLSGVALEDYIIPLMRLRHRQSLKTLLVTKCQAIDQLFFKYWMSTGVEIHGDSFVDEKAMQLVREEENR